MLTNYLGFSLSVIIILMPLPTTAEAAIAYQIEIDPLTRECGAPRVSTLSGLRSRSIPGKNPNKKQAPSIDIATDTGLPVYAYDFAVVLSSFSLKRSIRLIISPIKPPYTNI